MESEEIIRAYMLEPGDIFKIGTTVYQVTKIANGKIYYCYYKCKRTQYDYGIGASSQERVILITNKTKQNECKNRPRNFSKS